MLEPADPLRLAREIADRTLFADAAAVDLADRVPQSHLEALAAAGLFGLSASGTTAAMQFDVTAALAGGCLATTFVWLQHQGALKAMARGAGAGSTLAASLATGATIGGVAITALRPPEPLLATPTATGFALTGEVPWVTGWGIADVLLVAALDIDLVRYFAVDATPGVGIETRRADLVAAHASGTVTLTFRRHTVVTDRLVATTPLAVVQHADASGLGANGALAVGVADRALRLAGPSALDPQLTEVRRRLLDGTATTLPDARAAASMLAVQAATLLTVRTGSRSVARPNDAERLLREAQFLLTFGSRPSIRDALERRSMTA